MSLRLIIVTDEGDLVQIDVSSGFIENKSKNLDFVFKLFSDLVLKIILAGGGVNYFATDIGRWEKLAREEELSSIIRASALDPIPFATLL